MPVGNPLLLSVVTTGLDDQALQLCLFKSVKSRTWSIPLSALSKDRHLNILPWLKNTTLNHAPSQYGIAIFLGKKRQLWIDRMEKLMAEHGQRSDDWINRNFVLTWLKLTSSHCKYQTRKRTTVYKRTFNPTFYSCSEV